VQYSRVRVQRDDDLEALYLDQADRLWRAIYAYAGDAEVASDAVAEAFAQLLHRGEGVRTPDRWIWRAGFRIAAGELKTRRGVEPLGPGIDVASLAGQELISTLRLLPARQRAALVLHYYGGYKAREIAEILGSTAATVRVHLSQGRRRLRKLLEEEND
jgi:RNA polymerase sigma-70 factor (ECF subfamily)